MGPADALYDDVGQRNELFIQKKEDLDQEDAAKFSQIVVDILVKNIQALTKKSLKS